MAGAPSTQTMQAFRRLGITAIGTVYVMSTAVIDHSILELRFIGTLQR